MNISEYNLLELNEKANILWENGVYIDHRIEYGKYKIVMYSLADWFIEVFYDVHNNEIKRIQALETDEQWHGYLESINLDYLMS